MDVYEIIKLLATQSIGLDDPTDSDIAVFMQFINQAYIELLQSTLVQNPLITVIHEQLDCVDGVLANPSQPIFNPRQVYNISLNKPLDEIIVDDVIRSDPGLKNTGIPNQWYYANGVINLYPITTSLVSEGGGFGFRYITNPDTLTQYSVSSDIQIPFLYQNILQFGAAYYVFQSETGFRDQSKMQLANDKWEEGKRKLFSYMKNISGRKHYSTYSPV